MGASKGVPLPTVVALRALAIKHEACGARVCDLFNGTKTLEALLARVSATDLGWVGACDTRRRPETRGPFDRWVHEVAGLKRAKIRLSEVALARFKANTTPMEFARKVTAALR